MTRVQFVPAVSRVNPPPPGTASLWTESLAGLAREQNREVIYSWGAIGAYVAAIETGGKKTHAVVALFSSGRPLGVPDRLEVKVGRSVHCVPLRLKSLGRLIG